MRVLRTGELAQIRRVQDLLSGPQDFQRGRRDNSSLTFSAGCGAGQKRKGGPALETDEPALDDGAGDAAAGVAVVYGDNGEALGDLALRP